MKNSELAAAVDTVLETYRALTTEIKDRKQNSGISVAVSGFYEGQISILNLICADLESLRQKS